MLYYKTTYLEVDWEEQTRRIELVWQGFCNSQNFRESIIKCVNLVEQQKLEYWLADLTDAKVISLADQDWLNTNLIPELGNLNVKRFAYIIPKDVLAQIALTRIKNKTTDASGVEIGYFDNKEEAVNWLK
jgi:hypothetical protein